MATKTEDSIAKREAKTRERNRPRLRPKQAEAAPKKAATKTKE